MRNLKEQNFRNVELVVAKRAKAKAQFSEFHAQGG